LLGLAGHPRVGGFIPAPAREATLRPEPDADHPREEQERAAAQTAAEDDP
jgi:hypothetical protein